MAGGNNNSRYHSPLDDYSDRKDRKKIIIQALYERNRTAITFSREEFFRNDIDIFVSGGDIVVEIQFPSELGFMPFTFSPYVVRSGTISGTSMKFP